MMTGLLGVALLLLIAFALSSNRRCINWRTIGFAFAIQVMLGAFVIYLPIGQQVLY